MLPSVFDINSLATKKLTEQNITSDLIARYLKNETEAFTKYLFSKYEQYRIEPVAEHVCSTERYQLP